MYRTLLSQLRTPPLTGAKLVQVMTTARFELPCMRPTRGHHPPSLVAARCAISALPEPRRHRGFVSQVASFRRRGLYFLKKPFDFGQGLRASEKDSDRMRYDRNIVRDEIFRIFRIFRIFMGSTPSRYFRIPHRTRVQKACLIGPLPV